jgi:hypothetical protein
LKAKYTVKTKKKAPPNSRRPPRPLPVLLLLTLLIGGCTAGQPRHLVWHQHYRAIEEIETERFVADNLTAAMAAYGPPLIPIKEHHVRQSVKRRDYAGIRQADVTDWPLLATKVLAYQECLPALKAAMPSEDALRAIGQGRPPHFLERREITTRINDLIQQGPSESTVLLPCRPHDPQPAAHLRDDQTSVEPADLLSPAILPLASPKRGRPGVELCELGDRERGVFILYVSVPEEDGAFYAQLSHETLHMLNPFLFDWYMEGLCNVFAEEMAEKFGFPWEKMARHLESRRRQDPYAIAYYMMRELKEACGTHLNTLLHFTAWTDKARTRMHIDIQAWLHTLPPKRREAARKIISSAGKDLQRHQGRRNHFSPVAPKTPPPR